MRVGEFTLQAVTPDGKTLPDVQVDGQWYVIGEPGVEFQIDVRRDASSRSTQLTASQAVWHGPRQQLLFHAESFSPLARQ